MIKSLYGVYRGDWCKELTPKLVLGKPVMINETERSLLYSRSEKDDLVGETDEIIAGPGEAIHFIKLCRKGRVVIGPEAEVAAWIRYYYFEPHLVPNPTTNLKIDQAFFKVCGVSVTREVLLSYPPEVAFRLQKLLRSRYYTGSSERNVLENLLKSMKGSK